MNRAARRADQRGRRGLVRDVRHLMLSEADDEPMRRRVRQLDDDAVLRVFSALVTSDDPLPDLIAADERRA
jgi:hypothetical protein